MPCGAGDYHNFETAFSQKVTRLVKTGKRLYKQSNSFLQCDRFLEHNLFAYFALINGLMATGGLS